MSRTPTISVVVVVPQHSLACKRAAKAALVGPGPRIELTVYRIAKSEVRVTATRTTMDTYGTLGHALGDVALVRRRVLEAVEAAYGEAEAVRKAKRRGLVVLPLPAVTTRAKEHQPTAIDMFSEDDEDDTEEVVVNRSPK